MILSRLITFEILRLNLSTISNKIFDCKKEISIYDINLFSVATSFAIFTTHTLLPSISLTKQANGLPKRTLYLAIIIII